MRTGLNRRDFVKGAAVISAGTMLAPSSGLFAAGSETIKVGLVGCGGRGKSALNDILNAAKHLNLKVEIAALADFFKEKAVHTAKQFGVSEDLAYGGADGYTKVMASDAQVVLLATPPVSRPAHLEAAVNAGKHVFMEKPVAVDPPGARKVIAMGQAAAEKKLSIVAGTQRRHDASYQKTKIAIDQGAIGPIRGGAIWWCGGALWCTAREPGESDASYLVRNWVSFTEMSGDHIVEQHVHNIDIANWFIGRHPNMAIGFGGRARRKTGNQFDFFSIDFDYGDDVHIHSMCRQIDGTYSRVSEFFTGTIGGTWGSGPEKAGYAKQVDIPEIPFVGNPYVQEHVDLLESILKGKPINEAENVAVSTLTGIMGRISAYTGQLVRWKDLVDESTSSPWYGLTLSPTEIDFQNNTVKAPSEDKCAIPGKESTD
ncbi:MAG: Gfo/Idh/MocA family oxidoreductase [Planctomycetales bacterium]|nr:Gfo/Idh/MocA family oxidoreductase [Planctomycetales bacterium]